MTTMKFTLSMPILLIVHIHAARLLQQVTNACNLNCNPDEKCYSTSTGPTCCKPHECAYGGLCLKDNLQFNCPVGFECVTNPDSPRGAGLCIDAKFSPIPPFELCTNKQCAFDTQCYQMSTGAECCDPNICEKGTCAGLGNVACPIGYECVKGCPTCSGVCVSPNIRHGETCNTCIQPLCACQLCPDGRTSFGCCGGCRYQFAFDGNIFCSSEPITDESSCPGAAPAPTPQSGNGPAEGDICTGCVKCPCELCEDAVINGQINVYGCCGGCQYRRNSAGFLVCAADFPIVITAEDCPRLSPTVTTPTTPTTPTTLPVTARPPTPRPVVPVVTCPNCKVGHCVSGKCSQCDFTHHSNAMGVCVPKRSCGETWDCDRAGGFRCRNDPRCRAPVENEPYCGAAMVNAPKICFDYDGYDFCKSDVDCNNGFECFLDAHYVSGSGFCGKYQI